MTASPTTKRKPKRAANENEKSAEQNVSAIPASEKGTETLAYKQSILNGLHSKVDFLMRGGRYFSPRQQEAVEALEYGLTTELNALTEEFKHRELDVKIAKFRALAELIKL